MSIRMCHYRACTVVALKALSRMGENAPENIRRRIIGLEHRLKNEVCHDLGIGEYTPGCLVDIPGDRHLSERTAETMHLLAQEIDKLMEAKAS